MTSASESARDGVGRGFKEEGTLGVQLETKQVGRRHSSTFSAQADESDAPACAFAELHPPFLELGDDV